MALFLRYLGHRSGASLGYFTGAGVTLVPGEVFEIAAAGIVLGRRAAADLRVASSQVAPRHCRVRLTGPDRALLEDLGSTNGTRVDGQPITHHTIGPGDVVTLADGFDFECCSRSDQLSH